MPQLLENLFVIAIQKIQQTFYLLFIVFLGNIALAGSIALLNVIIQAGPLFPNIFRKTAAAGTEMLEFSGQLNYILYCSAAGIRAKIP